MDKTRASALASLCLGLAAATAAPAFILTPMLGGVQAIDEWTHDATGRYRIVADEAERAAYESGSAEAGWRRTGYAFSVPLSFIGPWPTLPRLEATCRFFNPAAGTHFFTANAAECEALRTGLGGWRYEGPSFGVEVPRDGACGYQPPLQTLPVYRLYNNRRNGFANHRFAADPKLRARLVAEGWIDEGVAFCAVGAHRQLQAFYDAKAPARIGGACQGEGCVVARNLKALDHTLAIAPVRVEWGQPYPLLNALTGWEQLPTRLFAATASNEYPALAAGSYVQTIDRAGSPSYPGFGPLGVHLAARDRTAAGVASIALRRELDPAAGERAVPWEGTRDSAVSLRMHVGFGRIEPGAGHAYGFPSLELRDQVTGRGILVTLQAFGTQAPADLAGFDASRDMVLVSTVLGPSASFGVTTGAAYRRCTAGECDSGPYESVFTFDIGREDFQAVLARARAVEPQLSAEPGRYRISAFECRVEVAGDAELGATIRRCAISHTH